MYPCCLHTDVIPHQGLSLKLLHCPLQIRKIKSLAARLVEACSHISTKVGFGRKRFALYRLSGIIVKMYFRIFECSEIS